MSFDFRLLGWLALQLIATQSLSTIMFGLSSGYWLAGFVGPIWVIAAPIIAVLDPTDIASRYIIYPGGVAYLLLIIIFCALIKKIPGLFAGMALFALNVISVVSLALIA